MTGSCRSAQGLSKILIFFAQKKTLALKPCRGPAPIGAFSISSREQDPRWHLFPSPDISFPFYDSLPLPSAPPGLLAPDILDGGGVRGGFSPESVACRAGSVAVFLGRADLSC